MKKDRVVMVADRKSQESKQLDEMRRGGLQWMGIGVEFTAVVCACSWVGNWLDKKGGTSPGFLVLFFLFGFVGMIYTMIKRAGGLKWKDDGGSNNNINDDGNDGGNDSNDDVPG